MQVAPDGALPLEDKRTKSQSYHAYDAQALLRLARLCRRFSTQSVDLFAFETADGRGLAKMMRWLAPYARREPPPTPWPFKQVERFNPLAYTKVFRSAAKAWGGAAAAAYEKIAEAQPGAAAAVENLLYPAP